MELYKGSQKIQDTGSYGIYHGSTPIGAVYKGSDKVYIFKKSTAWQAGATLQEYKVSPWCTKIRVDVVGSKGWNGGNGGRVQCDLTVTPNQVIYISVGNIPSNRYSPTYNAADIRTNNSGLTDTTSLQSRLVVAGGGGSTGNQSGSGGAGGGLAGGNGYGGDGKSAYGGTQTSGGSGGAAGAAGGNGYAGQFGLGGGTGSTDAGAGGAGWYGGGGGGHSAYYQVWGGNGGGGSSYTDANLCGNVVHTQGYQNGAGYITITEIE